MRIFVTGVGGFIGCSLAAEAARRGHQIRGLVRSTEKPEACKTFGIVPVLGTLADHDLLTEEAKAADAAVNALLKALTGSGKALIHTNGSTIVADHVNGEPSDAVFDEDHMQTPTADKAVRAALDQAILSAPGIRSVILCNALIFGDVLGPKARSVELACFLFDVRRV